MITDGEDMQSPYPYHGSQGMNPLMEHLLSKQYKIEWTIIVVGMNRKHKAHNLYQDLCLATGGSFLSIDNGMTHRYDANDVKVKKFINDIKVSHSDNAKARDKVIRDNLAKFNKRMLDGEAEKFEWLKSLPPPPHSK